MQSNARTHNRHRERRERNAITKFGLVKQQNKNICLADIFACAIFFLIQFHQWSLPLCTVFSTFQLPTPSFVAVWIFMMIILVFHHFLFRIYFLVGRMWPNAAPAAVTAAIHLFLFVLLLCSSNARVRFNKNYFRCHLRCVHARTNMYFYYCSVPARAI